MKKLTKTLTKKFLYKKYIINKKSTIQIAKIIDCDSKTIWYYLKKHDIKIRTKREGKKGTKRPDMILLNKLINRKGKNNSHYIDGRTLKKYYCIDCGIEINGYRAKRCPFCGRKMEGLNDQ